MKYRLLIIGLVIIPFYSGFGQLDTKIYKKSKEIKLDSFNHKPFFAYESSLSIIYLDKNLVIKDIKKHLKNKKLCDLRRKNYHKILDKFSGDDSSFFVIHPTLPPDLLYMFGDIPDTDTITGYAPLDYYSRSLRADIMKNYIPPYGFTTQLDTSSLIHLEKYYDWMINDLVLKGKAMIFNKELQN